MTRVCTICGHQNCEAINAEYLNGTPYRNISEQYSVSVTALSRHKKHLPTRAIEAAGRDKALKLTNIVDLVIADFEQVRERFNKIADKAAACGDISNEISAMREVRATLTDTLKSKGMWAPSTAVQVNVNAVKIDQTPEWPILLKVLHEHPEIQEELITAIKGAGL